MLVLSSDRRVSHPTNLETKISDRTLSFLAITIFYNSLTLNLSLRQKAQGPSEHTEIIHPKPAHNHTNKMDSNDIPDYYESLLRQIIPDQDDDFYSHTTSASDSYYTPIPEYYRDTLASRHYQPRTTTSSFSRPQPPAAYLNALTSPPRHAISLFAAVALTLLAHRDLLCLAAYWALRLLRPVVPADLHRSAAARLQRAAFVPLRNGLVSPYWATLHALKWELRRNVEAARLMAGTYAVVFFGLAWVREETGRDLLGWVDGTFGIVGAVYLQLVLVSLAVRWGSRTSAAVLWFLWEVVVGVWGGMVEVAKGVVGRHWRVMFAAWAVWASFRMMSCVDFGEVWEKTVKDVFLMCAEVIYLTGDIFRDAGKGSGGY